MDQVTKKRFAYIAWGKEQKSLTEKERMRKLKDLCLQVATEEKYPN
jgi:hypothetical protein